MPLALPAILISQLDVLSHAFAGSHPLPRGLSVSWIFFVLSCSQVLTPHRHRKFWLLYSIFPLMLPSRLPARTIQTSRDSRRGVRDAVEDCSQSPAFLLVVSIVCFCLFRIKTIITITQLLINNNSNMPASRSRSL